MSSLSIEQLRSAFKKPENNNSQPNNYYPFWNMKEDEQATIRFLPDADESNPYGFLVEKKSHTLLVNGQKKTLPCLTMYGEECPVCKVSREYYKVDDKENGKKYYRKVQYIAQAIVEDNPIPASGDEEDATGKVKLVALGYQLHNIIKAAFEDGDLDEVPFDYDGGTDFIIKKTKQGDYPSYALSKFARKSRALDEDTIAGLQLMDLKSVLPKNPGLDRVEAMLEADLSGGSYEEPASSSAPAKAPEAESVKAESAPVVEAEVPAEVPAEEAADQDADDILAAIKARRDAKQA